MLGLFQELRNLNLPTGDFAIFGSGPLIVRGVIPATNDLDVLCRGAAWEQAQSIGKVEYLAEYDVNIVTVLDGRLTFGTKWGIGDLDADELINSAEQIDGLPFVRLKHVVGYKRQRASSKDLQHIAALENSIFACDR